MYPILIEHKQTPKQKFLAALDAMEMDYHEAPPNTIHLAWITKFHFDSRGHFTRTSPPDVDR